MLRIPFTLPEVGLNEVKGMVWVNDGFLVLSVRSSLMGLADTDKEHIQIEPAAVTDLSLKKGLFVDKLIITPKSTKLLDLVPGEHPASLNLRIWKKHRSAVENLIDAFYELPLKAPDAG